MSAPIKILLADDEAVVVDILAKKVRDAGYEVVVAYDGLKAWEMIQEHKPDVVVLDLTMPGLEGWQVLEKLRSNPPTKVWTPVIIVSAHGDVGHMEKSMRLEADHYLTKPCKVEHVLKGIKTVLTLAATRNL